MSRFGCRRWRVLALAVAALLALVVTVSAVLNPWHVAAGPLVAWSGAAVTVLLCGTAAACLPPRFRRVAATVTVVAGVLVLLVAVTALAPLAVGLPVAVLSAGVGVALVLRVRRLPVRAVSALLTVAGLAGGSVVALGWVLVEVVNGGQTVAVVASPYDPDRQAVVVVGNGLGVGTRPDVLLRTTNSWPTRQVLLWRGPGESAPPASVRFTTPGRIQITTVHGCRYRLQASLDAATTRVLYLRDCR